MAVDRKKFSNDPITDLAFNVIYDAIEIIQKPRSTENWNQAFEFLMNIQEDNLWLEATGLSRKFLRDLALQRAEKGVAYSKKPAKLKQKPAVLTYNGKTMYLSAWAHELGVTVNTLKWRYYKQKMPIEKVLTPGKIKTRRQLRCSKTV